MAKNAPTPALVSLQALLVLPAGGIGLIRIAAFVFGPALLTAQIASPRAHRSCRRGHVRRGFDRSRSRMRERLAYSCMAQSLAVAMGTYLRFQRVCFAAALQVVAGACGWRLY